jgi:hypothetical protein
MFVTRKRLSRRTVLRGLGTAIALPYLDAMMPAFGAPASVAAADKATRLAFVYLPNGTVMENWTPATAGADWESTPTLRPFEPFRQDMSVLTGLADHNGNPLGDGGGDHARAAASFLTGVHPFKTAGSDIRAGISADQVIAKHMATKTKLASLELGCDDSRIIGSCDTGYSCAYTNNISWRSPTSPMPPETNPRLVFERLFGTADLTLDPETRARRSQYRKSILDTARERTNELMLDLGPSDRRKVDEYLYAIREIEKRIAANENDDRGLTVGVDKPTGIPVEFADYMKLMFDLQVLAFQADVTRVTTQMVGREGSVRVYPEIGVADPHHPLSHHRDNPESLAKLSKINGLHAELASYFIGKLKTTEDGDGSLLDHSMVVYAGGISDSNKHLHENLPVLLFGRAHGGLNPGRHIVYKEETPVTNLHVTLMDRMGLTPEPIGDSNGVLEQLTAL